MTKSEELCKLLGIEAKKEIAMHCKTLCIHPTCVMNKDCKDYKSKGVYPDLTKPSNFVKLLEMLRKNNTIIRFYPEYVSIGLDGGLCIEVKEKTVIDSLLFIAKEVGNDFNKACGLQNLKHQAQQTEWEF